MWILSTFIHAFNIEEGTDFLDEEVNPECCIVPPWHPAALQKLCDQKRFVIDGIKDAWLSADTFGKKFKFALVEVGLDVRIAFLGEVVIHPIGQIISTTLILWPYQHTDLDVDYLIRVVLPYA